MTNHTASLTVRLHKIRKGAYVLDREIPAESFAAAREIATGEKFATVIRTHTETVVALTDAVGTFHVVAANR